MDSQKDLTNQLLKLLDKIVQNKTYGSVEIFFEEGRVTQVTQRIINKFQNRPKDSPKKRAEKISSSVTTKTSDSLPSSL